jgi:preprotein translocase subunit YajC
MNHFFVLGQAGSSQLLGVIFPFVLMFIVLYFLLLRPQRKKENERKKMIDAVKKGDKVVTIGGMHGTVVQVKDDDLIIRIDPQKDICVKFTRAAVHRVVSAEKGEEPKP